MQQMGMAPPTPTPTILSSPLQPMVSQNYDYLSLFGPFKSTEPGLWSKKFMGTKVLKISIHVDATVLMLRVLTART